MSSEIFYELYVSGNGLRYRGFKSGVYIAYSSLPLPERFINNCSRSSSGRLEHNGPASEENSHQGDYTWGLGGRQDEFDEPVCQLEVQLSV